MTILLWFLFYLVSDHDQVNCQDKIDVSGYSRGSVIINCQYNPVKYKDKIKRFCKMEGEQCLKPDSIPGGQKKFITADDTVAGVFSVLIRNLDWQDAGKYRCKAEGGENLKDVVVKVEEDVDGCNVEPISKRVNKGEDVIFTCTLQCKNVAGQVYSYKVANQKIQANPPEWSITTFTLTISDVIGEDEGLYLCGVEKEKNEPNRVSPYVTVFKEMRLQVTGASGSLPIIITVCVVLPLLLIAGFALLICKLRHKIAQDTTSLTSRGNNVNADEVTTGACSVEVTNQQATPPTIYATVQKPSAPQDLYSLVQQPKAASATEEFNL